MATQARPKLTAEEAKSFSRYSAANAGHVEGALECGCQAYQDVYTYNRWRALGYQVQRGQKAIRIPVIVEREKEDEAGNTSRARSFRTSAVFCKHQVAPTGEKAAAPTPQAPEPEPFAGDFIRGPKAIAAEQAIAHPTPEPTPEPTNRIDALMNNWQEV